MKYQRIAIAFSIFNLLLLVFLLAQKPSDAQQSVMPIVRTRAFELVDENGKTRAQINIENTGEVVFRLRDETGKIRSKYGAGKDGSGFTLMDDRTEATVQIRANKSGSEMFVLDRSGNKTALK
jgi:hypothetical protein